MLQCDSATTLTPSISVAHSLPALKGDDAARGDCKRQNRGRPLPECAGTRSVKPQQDPSRPLRQRETSQSYYIVHRHTAMAGHDQAPLRDQDILPPRER
jgi:hypothetical protein